MTLAVAGDGRIGRGLAACLGTVAAGPAESATVEAADLVVIAVTTGDEARGVVLAARRGQQIVDLTTQSIESALACAAVARERGASYVGGGIVGGASSVAAGDALLLLGPARDVSGLPPRLALAGRVRAFDRLDQAVAAKLLHNWCLLMSAWAISGALAAARHLDIEEALVDVLELGTAGRPVRELSIIRDRSDPSSSYRAGLAAKDLDAIATSFPTMTERSPANLEHVRDALVAGGSTPFTAAMYDAWPAS